MKHDCKCGICFLALIIIIFSFLKTGASKWIIIISATLIFLMELIYILKNGCDCGKSCSKNHKTGEEIFLEKEKNPDFPSQKEVEETMKKPMPKTIKAKK